MSLLGRARKGLKVIMSAITSKTFRMKKTIWSPASTQHTCTMIDIDNIQAWPQIYIYIYIYI